MSIDSNKRVGLLSFLLFFLFDALLIMAFGESAATELVCAVVANMVKPLIVLSFLAGLVCFGFSAFGIGKTANNNLKDLEDNLSPFRKSDNKQTAATAVLEKCRAKVAELKNEKAFELWGVSTAPRHLYNRLRALGIEGESAESQSGAQEVSGLQDLHELTLQTELSRPSSTGMNTVISFLLILGILGTLTGVHGVIKAGVKDVQTLAPALEPSQWAVGFTVLLLILRGIYLRMVDRYIYRLDKLTMECLRPALSPAKSKDTADEGAVSYINSTLNQIGHGQLKAHGDWKVAPFADFSGITAGLKEETETVAKDLEHCLSKQKKEVAPVPPPLPAVAEQKKKQEKKRRAVVWEARGVSDQVRSLDSSVTEAIEELTAMQNMGVGVVEENAVQEDRRLISETVFALQGSVPKNARLQQVQRTLRRRIVTQQDMDDFIDRLEQKDKEQRGAMSGAFAAAGVQQ